MRLVLVCLLLLGVPVGVGAFTFVYAKGFSYLSTDPRACVNCHVMNEQYDAWLKSGHRHAATCVECHLPHAGSGEVGGQGGPRVPALGGVHAAELQGADRDHGARSADGQENCVRCHAELGSRLLATAGPAGERSTACTATPGQAMAPAAETGSSREEPTCRRPDATDLVARCLGFVGVAGLTVLLLALLTNIFERKQEARQPSCAWSR